MRASRGVAGVSDLCFRETCVEASRFSHARLVRHPSGVGLRAAHAGLGRDAAHHRRRLTWLVLASTPGGGSFLGPRFTGASRFGGDSLLRGSTREGVVCWLRCIKYLSARPEVPCFGMPPKRRSGVSASKLACTGAMSSIPANSPVSAARVRGHRGRERYFHQRPRIVGDGGVGLCPRVSVRGLPVCDGRLRFVAWGQ